MQHYVVGISLVFVALTVAACDGFGDLDVANPNSPNLDQVFADPQEYPALLSGAYRTWWNEGIGTNPNLALGVAAETFTSGYGSWGMAEYYRVPRQALINADADDVVLNPIYGAWYSYYSGLPTVNNIIRQIEQHGQQVLLGDTDYTQGALAHAYFLQGLFIGHLALLYDKAFLITEETDVIEFDYQFTPTAEMIAFALDRMDQAIEICNTRTFADPIQMMPAVQWDNASLCRFIHSNAARLLAASARTQAETEALDWNRVLNYARNGITEDFYIQSENGWNGLAISRDPYAVVTIEGWDWIRPHQRLIHMLAPNDPSAVYPRPEGVAELPEVTNPLDLRLLTDMEYVGRHGAWNPARRGYHVLSEYSYTRYQDYMEDGIGPIYFFLAAENDLLQAEALLRSGGSTAEAAELINATRVDRGGMPPLSGGEPQQALLDALLHERYIELLYTYPALGFFDRRRTDDLMEGTARQLPVPAKELLLHGFEVYTFGG